MNRNKGLIFFLVVILFVTGSKLYQHFDFQNQRFEKPALDAIYGLAFVLSLVGLIVNLFKKPSTN